MTCSLKKGKKNPERSEKGPDRGAPMMPSIITCAT